MTRKEIVETVINEMKISSVAEAKGIFIGAYKHAIAQSNYRWSCFAEWHQMENYKMNLAAVPLAEKTIKRWCKTGDEFNEIMHDIHQSLTLFIETKGEWDSRDDREFYYD